MSVGIDSRVNVVLEKGIRMASRVERRIIHLLPRVGWLLLPQECLVRLWQLWRLYQLYRRDIRPLKDHFEICDSSVWACRKLWDGISGNVFERHLFGRSWKKQELGMAGWELGPVWWRKVVPLINDWERPFTMGWTLVWEHPRIVWKGG